MGIDIEELIDVPEICIDVPNFGERVFVLEQKSTGKKVQVPCGFCGGSETGEIEGADGTKARCPNRCDHGTEMVDAPREWIVLGTADCERECDRELHVYQYRLTDGCIEVVLQDADEDIWEEDAYPIADIFTSEAKAFAEAEERNSKR